MTFLTQDFQMGPNGAPKAQNLCKMTLASGYRWKAAEKGFKMSYSLLDDSPPGPTYTADTVSTWTGHEKDKISKPLKRHRITCDPKFS